MSSVIVLLRNAVFRNKFLVLIAAFLLASCSQIEKKDIIDDGSYTLDPIFERYYQELGGQGVLGPAISPLFSEDDEVYQYTTTCLLSYSQKTKQYRLASLGKELIVGELPVDCQENGEDLFKNGHNIYPEFNKKINSLGGLNAVGLPLTELRLNQKKHRYEQYFENLGFYQMADDPHGPVFLLAFGAWRCGELCAVTPPLNSRIDIPVKKVAPFVIFIENVGIEYTGFALTEPYLSQDGNLEQVFENVILFVNPDHPDRVIYETCLSWWGINLIRWKCLEMSRIIFSIQLMMTWVSIFLLNSSNISR